jgi:Ca2+-binding EF-hand superfamily protein
MKQVAIFLCVCLFCMSAWCQEGDDAPKSADETVLHALPKVPTLATIIGKGNARTEPGKWVQELLKKKETRARVEIVLLKQKLIADQEAQNAEERERIRRRQLYDKALGSLFDTEPTKQDGKKKLISMKLDFQLPEMEAYRRLVEVYQKRAALASDVVETLTRLDRDSDGKLAGEEYRDAAYIFNATQRLFLAVDNDGDGYISSNEIDAAKVLPADAAAALAAGAKEAATTDTFLIKGFDADKNGVLRIEERKALSSAYLDIALKSTQEAANYQRLHDDLSAARQVAAAKFENLTIEVTEPR